VLHYARLKLRTVKGDRATVQAIHEIPDLPGYWGYVEAFNDRREAKLRDVLAVVLRARELAEAEFTTTDRGEA
jgi:hypothetical protein